MGSTHSIHIIRWRATILRSGCFDPDALIVPNHFFARNPRIISGIPIRPCSSIVSLIAGACVGRIYLSVPAHSSFMTWHTASITDRFIFAFLPSLSICLKAFVRVSTIFACGQTNSWCIVSSLHGHPGHWFTPVICWRLCPTGSHPCMILLVNIFLVSLKPRRTVPMASQ